MRILLVTGAEIRRSVYLTWQIDYSDPKTVIDNVDTLPDGTKIEWTTTPTTPGDNQDAVITVTYPDGTKDTVKVTVNVRKTSGSSEGSSEASSLGKCDATLLGFGIPLLALLPIGLAVSVGIPAIQPAIDQVSERIAAANVGLQQQIGIFIPGIAEPMARLDAQLRQFGFETAQAAGGLAALAALIGVIATIATACTPEGPSSSS